MNRSSGRRTALVVGAGLAIVVTLTLGALFGRGGSPTAKHAEAATPAPTRMLLVFHGAESSASTTPTLLRVQLLSGVLTGQDATVLSDDNCDTDAAGVSHCLSRLRLADGSVVVVRHPHNMMSIPVSNPATTSDSPPPDRLYSDA